MGKYKGKIPFKLFDYGRIGHYFNKCPYKDRNKNLEDYEYKRNKNQYKKKKGYFKQKKNMYERDDISSYNEDDNNSQEVLFFYKKYRHESSNNENEDYEVFDNKAKVDFEGESICTWKELKKLRKKYALVKYQLEVLIQKNPSSKLTSREDEKIIVNQKLQLEEAKVTKECLLEQLREKEEIGQA